MNTKYKFIFDVDGTLTPSRQSIDGEFQRWFLEFSYSNEVYLVTGSDYPKTLEQLGKTVCENAVTVFNCSGSDIWERGKNIFTDSWILPEKAHNWLSNKLQQSEFPKRTGNHFEHRPGMVNFSVVGRNANRQERAEYVSWDKEHGERDLISFLFNQQFLDLEATVGGETGIDIAPKGKNKSQILNYFEKDDKLVFFGDRIDKRGNDYPLAKIIIDNNLGSCYNVKNWNDTWEKLKDYDR